MSLLRLALVVLIAASTLPGETVTYDVYNIGGSTWRYDYTIVDPAAFPINQGITFDFALELYGPLSNPIAPAGWDVQTWNPDDPFGASGGFDLLALVDKPALTGLSIQFEYLGSGTPGPQPFEIYTIDPDFAVTGGGNTSHVPEPSAVLTLGAVGGGLAAFGALAALRSRRRRTT
jgi:hypothetical protein